jgi:hypothetical protein
MVLRRKMTGASAGRSAQNQLPIKLLAVSLPYETVRQYCVGASVRDQRPIPG